MDPLSVAASVAGLISLTLEVSQTVGTYYKAVKDAPKSIREIEQELTLINAVLKQLDDLLRSPNMAQCSFAQSSILMSAVTSCDQCIKDVSFKLPQPKQNGSFRARDSLKWPFVEKESQTRLEVLRRYTSTFSFSLHVEGCKLLAQCSEDATNTLKVQLDTSQKILELTKDIATMAESVKEASRMSGQVADILYLLTSFHAVPSSIEDISNDIKTLMLTSQETKDESVLDWLSPTTYSQRHTDIRSRRLQGTGQWLLGCKVFHDWLENGDPILWCTGGPGVGKSCLASLIIDHVLEHKVLGASHNTALAYYYFDYRDQDGQTPVTFLASILRQLVTQRKDSHLPLLKLYERVKRDRAQITEADLLMIIKECYSSFDECYIVIDALDECVKNAHRKKIMNTVNSLDLGIGHLCFTSRPHVHDIKQSFLHAQKIEIGASEADIRSYCHHMMEDDESIMEILDEPLKEEVADSIAAKAQGMYATFSFAALIALNFQQVIDLEIKSLVSHALVRFLLPVLQIQTILEAMTKSEVRKALRNLSTSLSEAFEDTMRRIKNETLARRDVGLRTLMWVLRARRPLRVSELRHALGTRVGESRLDNDNLLLPRFIIECCSGLIAIDDKSSTVRLVHYTLQDYLQSVYQDRLSEDETEITKICLTYMCFEEANVYNFLKYASVYWGHHAQQATVSEIGALALKFLKDLPRVARAREIQVRLSSHRAGPLQFCSGLDALSMVAGFGLSELTGLLLDEGLPINANDSFGNTALHEAAIHCKLGATKVLLARSAKTNVLNANFNSPLFLAVSNEHDEVTMELLKHGANPDVRCLDDWTALHKAADTGNLSIVKLLLDHGASVDAKSSRGLIPLHRAAGRGQLEIATILVERGSEIDALTYDDWTPLHGASSSGKHEAFGLLLRNGAKIDFLSRDGYTPLHRACLGGHLMAVSLLLTSGANHMIKDSDSNLPLHLAAKGGWIEISIRLLECDLSTALIQLSTHNNMNRTPREEASHAYHWRCYRLASMLRDTELEYRGLSVHNLKTAIQDNDMPQVEWIVAAGTDIGLMPDEGLTPLHQALLLGEEVQAQSLLHAGASVDNTSVAGWQALHFAAQIGSVELVQTCLKNGADIAARTKDGQTVLHIACKSGAVSTTELLLRKGADVEAQDCKGVRPLHVAASFGHKDVVELLLAWGADIWARDNSGRKVHGCAAKAGHHDLVEYVRMMTLQSTKDFGRQHTHDPTLHGRPDRSGGKTV